MALFKRNKQAKKASQKPNEHSAEKDIAIIGMACRFPGANDYQAYWENLKNGVNSIREIPKERWDINQYYSPNIDESNKSVSKWGGLLDDIASFDNQFFQISPREAENMDPQQRILLEEAWHCIEDAGIQPDTLQTHSTSVYVGVMAIDYQHQITQTNVATDSYACVGNYEGILANRLSYTMNLSGESKAIDTACSSSLVALHDARNSLLLNESQYAMAAGVSVICHPWKYISFSKSRMLSPDGQCKTFDKDANGYVPGEGVGILLLTTLENAIKHNHHIHAIIKGSAVNHTGKSQSITAPRVEAQRNVIQAAQQAASITPEQITYIEAHGTGTSLGDPIEIESLTQAFQTNETEKKQYCAIGSVKTNIGHLEAAAGMAGLIKVILMMQHQTIAPTLNVKTVNPIIDFEHSPFWLATQGEPWLTKNGNPRYAGISSFGFGGVNAHVILSEYKNRKEKHQENHKNVTHSEQPNHAEQAYPFLLSTKSEESLKNLLTNWQAYTKTNAFEAQPLNDISYTLVQGRMALPYRFSLPVHSKEELIQQLNQALENIAYTNEQSEKNQTLDASQLILAIHELPTIDFAVFQHLCHQISAINQIFNHCVQALRALNQDKIIKSWAKKKKKPKETTQVALQFTVLYSLARHLLEEGLKPTQITGTGVGQLVSAAISGLIDLHTALAIILKKQKVKALLFKTPQITLYEPGLKKQIAPITITEDYCQRLIDTIASEEESIKNNLKPILEKSQLLLTNQYTFKKHVEEWQIELKKQDIDWENLFSTTNTPALLLIVLSVSLKKLNQKWQLADKVIIESEALAECIDLIVDGALSYQDAITLLHAPDTEAISEVTNHLATKQLYIDLKKPYTLLRSQQAHRWDEAEKMLWLSQFGKTSLSTDELNQQIKQNDHKSEEEKEKKTRWVIIGENQHDKEISSQSNTITLNTLNQSGVTQCLLNLWQAGLLPNISKEAL